jgi:hypothetical protein
MPKLWHYISGLTMKLALVQCFYNYTADNCTYRSINESLPQYLLQQLTSHKASQRPNGKLEWQKGQYN